MNFHGNVGTEAKNILNTVRINLISLISELWVVLTYSIEKILP